MFESNFSGSVYNISEFERFLVKDFALPAKMAKHKTIWPQFAVNCLLSTNNNFFASIENKILAQFLFQRFNFFAGKIENAGHLVSIEPDLSLFKFIDNKESVAIKEELSLVEIVLDDRPFVVDSLYNILNEEGLKIKQFIHPIFSVTKVKGKWQELSIAKVGSNNRISYVCCILVKPAAYEWKNLEVKIKESLDQLTAITSDYQTIKKEIENYTVKNNDEISESIAESEQREVFSWYLRGNLIFFGHGIIQENKISKDTRWTDIKNKLGWLKLIGQAKNQKIIEMVLEALGRFNNTDLKNSLMELKARSMVHKREKIILALHKIQDKNYKTVVIIIPCIFTNNSYHEPILRIPIVRVKLSGILERMGMLEGSHDYKDAVEFFGQFPRQEIFRLDRDELYYLYTKTRDLWDVDQLILNTYYRNGIDYVRVVLIIPAENMSAGTFEIVEKSLRTYWGIKPSYAYYFFYKQLAHLHFAYFTDYEQIKNFNTQKFAEKLKYRLKSWKETLLEMINSLSNKSEVQYLKSLAQIDFSEEYKSTTTPQAAIEDLKNIKLLIDEGKDVVTIKTEFNSQSNVSIYSFNDYSLRSLFLKFDSLGIEPLDAEKTEIALKDKKIYLQKYLANHPTLPDSGVQSFDLRFTEFFKEFLTDEIENDHIFELLVKTNLNFKKIKLLRVYRNYLSLINLNFNQTNLNRVLLDHPKFAEKFWQCFEKKFNPEVSNHKKMDQSHLSEDFQALEKIILDTKTLLEDSALRSFLEIIKATVRTNFYMPEFEAIAIKIDCMATEAIPSPKPMYEIFVVDEILEGIHLRGGKISRGGIRHSDRIDDYRDEVLGLMKTQMLKNVVIVPVGAKGGFIIKKKFSSRKEQREQAPLFYKAYIKNLLSLTDNIKNNKVIKADNMVNYDDDDSYLVVAADKGTASFSDFANEISLSSDYWLKDAFASGGSNGYNHKEIGITARGAFESLKIHFQELGYDFAKDLFTVVAIGDMSGDVFGNGMLLSPNIKLVGAFNHLHIFVDPNPNAKKSFLERKRLFNAPQSTWTDYNKKFISEGGGVFERSSKSIKLSKEMMDLLKTSKQSLSGIELIRQLLKLKVDMLFNGGIGVYVKSKNETNAEVGDKNNDSVRVDANDLAVKMIVEGGNLGITQKGRIDFDVKGGLINSDAIDNSAGVDMSDHEVNIKILLNIMLEQSLIKSEKQIRSILIELTESVTDLCLLDNQLQAYRISLDSRKSSQDTNLYYSTIEKLTELMELNHDDNFIPDKEWFYDLAKKSKPFPRPILAILISCTKNYVFKKILESKIPDYSEMEAYFVDYFPAYLQENFPLLKIKHPLRREIICSAMANFFVNSSGLSFLTKIYNITGSKDIDIINAFFINNFLFPEDNLRHLLLQNCRPKDFDKACEFVLKLEDTVKSRLVWLLANFELEDINFGNMKKFKNHISDFLKQPAKIKYKKEGEQKNIHDQLSKMGYDEAIINKYLDLIALDNPLDAATIKQESKLGFDQIKSVIMLLENNLNLSEIEDTLFNIISDDEWQKILAGNLIFKTNVIKKSIYKHACDYISKNGLKNVMSLFSGNQSIEFETYKKNWLKFSNSPKSPLSAISILLDNLAEYDKFFLK